MIKQEFEELADINISDEVYKVIETVYINFDRWNNSKQEFVIFFQKTR